MNKKGTRARSPHLYRTEFRTGKVTVRPGFSGESRFLTTCSGKITVLPGRPFAQFLAWCPGFVPICPSLQPLRFYLYIRKIAGGQGSALDPARELTRLSQTRKSDPRRLALAPYNSRLQHSSLTAVPKSWSPYLGKFGATL